MTSFFNAIGSASEAAFGVLKHLLMAGDMFFIIAGTALTIGWIAHMIKNQDDKGWFEAENNNH